jgi:hypothetical protein
MAICVANLIVTCLSVFLMTDGGYVMTSETTKQRADDVHGIPALAAGVFKILGPMAGLIRYIEKESEDIQMLARDVVDRIDQVKKVCVHFNHQFIGLQ